jgi:hypothetical protein
MDIVRLLSSSASAVFAGGAEGCWGPSSLLSVTSVPCRGLREGNWSFAIVADFTDAESYRQYDLEDGHNRLRAELAPHAEQVGRAQFEL